MKNLVLFLLLTVLVGCSAKPQQLGQAIADVKKEAGEVVCYYFDSDENKPPRGKPTGYGGVGGLASGE